MKQKDNLKIQYERQLEIRNYRRAIVSKKMKRYQIRWFDAKESYSKFEIKKPLKRRNSMPSIDDTWKRLEKQCDVDIRNAVVS
jgi:hypothetical protein